MISEICGTTPDRCTFRLKISAYNPRETTPSWIRAPPPSLMPDHRPAGLQREIQYLDDLFAVDLAERPAEDGDVLGEHADVPAVDGAVAGDDAVAVRPVVGQPEVGRAVPGERVELDERSRVQQHVDPLAGGLLALGVLPFDGLGRPGVHVFVQPAVEVGQLAGGGVRGGLGSARWLVAVRGSLDSRCAVAAVPSSPSDSRALLDRLTG